MGSGRPGPRLSSQPSSGGPSPHPAGHAPPPVRGTGPDARLKIKPAGAKVVKYEGDGDPEVPLADGQVVVVLTQTYRRVKTEDGRDFFVRKAFLKKVFPKSSAVNLTELTKKPKKDAATPMNKRTLRWWQRVLKNKRWWQRVRYHRKT